MNRQIKLHSLYQEHWPSIYKYMKKHSRLSGPTVMDISDAYFTSHTKLMIVGQQTYGWERGDLEALLQAYRDFNFGEDWYRSPFWNMTSKIADILGISRHSIAWTNLVKCDYESGRPPKDIEEKIQTAFPVLQKEISILSPDVLIFFTGPNYDERLTASLLGTSLDAVSSHKPRFLSRISNPRLPANSFRTYHPNYLRRSGLEKKFLNFIKKISNA